ncbi:MFS transporter [Cellulomonas oligotrophica]|uniref:Membrane protein n=1 Tax=Cellulomonas oligotrophica TaxID=931536 RepID=A0A7Y9JY49_9CELL|nr:MFS transporter [Cellulomonas oligotrophica]NYD84695.1 UMF1 family MFS transporter [Cellulomonas oligotrophica]GIG31762.1 membrane protein [Cellulomonas oligotrophica]
MSVDASTTRPGSTPAPPRPRDVAAWAAWDWGSAAFNAVVTTFVFTVWLTSESFVAPGEDPATAVARHTAWLGWGMTAAGVVVAVLAPALGALADTAARRRRQLAVASAVVVTLTAAMALVDPGAADPGRQVLLGIGLLALGTVAFEIASVAYNAQLLEVSTPRTVGRVSGLGWGAGYLGGIVLLLAVYTGLIAPEVGWFGVTSENGADIRATVLLAAAWTAVFSLPALLRRPPARVAAADGPAAAPARRTLVDAYRQVGRDVRSLWRTRRATVWFLAASAVYRDGLAGVFTFGAVLAAGTFGFDAAQVLVFAVAANVVAGVSTLVAGWFDDRVGPRRVVLVSLVLLVAAGTALLVLHDRGQTAFWVCGLLLTAGVGPAQSSSRTLLARLAPPAREAELFGLYATSGRAASFLAPAAFSVAVTLGGAQHWGVLGIVAVLATGLGLLLAVRLPASAAGGAAARGPVPARPVTAEGTTQP